MHLPCLCTLDSITAKTSVKTAVRVSNDGLSAATWKTVLFATAVPTTLAMNGIPPSDHIVLQVAVRTCIFYSGLRMHREGEETPLLGDGEQGHLLGWRSSTQYFLSIGLCRLFRVRNPASGSAVAAEG